MRVEINYGAGEKNEVIAQGSKKFIDLNQILEEFLNSDKGYRIEIYRWNISVNPAVKRYKKRYMIDTVRIVWTVNYLNNKKGVIC